MACRRRGAAQRGKRVRGAALRSPCSSAVTHHQHVHLAREAVGPYNAVCARVGKVTCGAGGSGSSLGGMRAAAATKMADAPLMPAVTVPPSTAAPKSSVTEAITQAARRESERLPTDVAKLRVV